MADNRYIGVTIGPIFDVMDLSSTPAALWASSYLFSFLSKSICEELIKRGVKPADIIAPYFDEKNEIADEMAREGVGLFHDHIIFRQNDFKIEDMKEVRAAALDRIHEGFDIKREYLESFIMVASVEFEADYSKGENPLLVCGRMFDSLELAKQFVPREIENPILKQFTGVDETDKDVGKNELIKSAAKKLGCTDWQLRKEKGTGLKSLGDIQVNGYYAIVRADGDSMGSYIDSLKSDEEIRRFSLDCFEYCKKISGKVKEYGGVTIYAGGDDLLAILPCVTRDGSKTILDFVTEAQKCFYRDLSFGITACYTKFPLYEALGDSAYLLFGVAKNRAWYDGNDRKNNTVLKIRKHSGQTESFILGNDTIDELLKAQHSIISAKSSGKEEVFLSALHKLALFRGLFDIAAKSGDHETIKAVFDNTFDAHSHDTGFLRETLPELFESIVLGKVDITSLDETGKLGAADTLSNVLRMFKFFIERDTEERSPGH